MAHWCWLDMKWCGSLSGLAVVVSCHFVSWCLPFSLVFSRLCCQFCCQHFPLVCSIAACSGFKWQAIMRHIKSLEWVANSAPSIFHQFYQCVNGHEIG